jgi:hypothetical protein
LLFEAPAFALLLLTVQKYSQPGHAQTQQQLLLLCVMFCFEELPKHQFQRSHPRIPRCRWKSALESCAGRAPKMLQVVVALE